MLSRHCHTSTETMSDGHRHEGPEQQRLPHGMLFKIMLVIHLHPARSSCRPHLFTKLVHLQSRWRPRQRPTDRHHIGLSQVLHSSIEMKPLPSASMRSKISMTLQPCRWIRTATLLPCSLRCSWKSGS